MSTSKSRTSMGSWMTRETDPGWHPTHLMTLISPSKGSSAQAGIDANPKPAKANPKEKLRIVDIMGLTSLSAGFDWRTHRKNKLPKRFGADDYPPFLPARRSPVFAYRLPTTRGPRRKKGLQGSFP